VRKRLPDMAKRLALIVAIGRHASDLRAVTIGEGDFAFGRGLTEWSADALIRGIDENFAETEHQSNSKLVLSIMREARQLTRTELYRRLDKRFDSRTLSAIIEVLAGTGNIAVIKQETTAKGGRPAEVYRYIDG
jgi:hypothetical protein